MKLLLLTLSLLLLLGACAPQQQGNSSTSTSSASADSTSSNTVPATSDSQNSSSSQSNSSQQPAAYKLAVPEGYTAARIGLRLEELGVCTPEDFLAATQEYDASGYSFLADRQENPNRGFSLEGYLFPATYDFKTTDSLDTIITAMLNATQSRLSPELLAQVDASGYSLDEILTLASIIEKEALGAEEMNRISSVLHNRLDSGMQLQCDVTIKYCTGVFEYYLPDRAEDLKYHYNTYRCAALPAGPICNPGMQAIRAALEPADTEYLFFVTDANNKYYYATTYEEHQANCKTAGVSTTSGNP